MPINATGKTTESALLDLFDARRPQARLLEQRAESATLRIDVAANLPHLDGHFVGSPILPGVAQIDWAVRFARELFALPLNVARLENIKFHDWIGADAQIDLLLERVGRDGVNFRIRSDAALHASGRILFVDPA